MQPRGSRKPQTEGSFNFDPEVFFDKWASDEYTVPRDINDFQKSIQRAFGLRATDSFIYRATAEVTLAQAQAYLAHGGQGRLHEWYRDSDGKQLPPPPPADIDAYTSLFAPTTTLTKSLTALRSNAKKDSLRSLIASHLSSNYQPGPITVPKLKSPSPNPYLDIWTWSCRAVDWAGPDPSTSDTRISHALLPVFYHHFGCIVPTWSALVTIRGLARGRTILDIGSGNGYWAYMLRRTAVPGLPGTGAEVLPVDSGLSAWRTMWVGDTIVADGVEYISKQRHGGAEDVLLLVYPQVGADFTAKVLRAYKGDTIIVAGTQNRNGFTAFRDETIAEWMGREMVDYEKVAQIPLPSFAGKDEALFAFVKRKP